MEISSVDAGVPHPCIDTDLHFWTFWRGAYLGAEMGVARLRVTVRELCCRLGFFYLIPHVRSQKRAVSMWYDVVNSRDELA